MHNGNDHHHSPHYSYVVLDAVEGDAMLIQASVFQYYVIYICTTIYGCLRT